MKGIKKIIFLSLGIVLLTLREDVASHEGYSLASQKNNNRSYNMFTSVSGYPSISPQKVSKESDWSSFFANLPRDLISRVKKREGISSVRILTNEETGGLTAVKIFSTNGVEPAHAHFETKQIFIVLDGELTFWKLSREKVLIEQTLKRGEHIFINPGESHGFRGTALVGGIDIGKGTALDTYDENEFPGITPKLNLTPILPLNQGTVTIQRPGYERRELLSGRNPNVEIMAETITSTIESTAASDWMIVIVSGELEINRNGNIQKLQPGDFIFLSSGESYTMSLASEIPAVTIVFSLF